MNNWLIFRASFWHLLEGVDLYKAYPVDHHDIFKYTPTFALFMAPLAIFPAKIGAVLWSLLGTSLFVYGLFRLPLKESHRRGAMWIALPEFIGSTQGFQSNIHLAALVVLFWTYLEEKRPWLAALCILSTFFIKIFGVVALALLLFSNYSFKDIKFLGKFTFASLVTSLGLFLAPAVILGFSGLIEQYTIWLAMLKHDAAISYGFSLMGVIHAITNGPVPILPTEAVAGVIMAIVFFLATQGGERARLLGLVAVLYYMVLFNHKSESPTFIICMIGFGIHQSLVLDKKWRWTLIVMTLFFVSILFADPFRFLRDDYLNPWAVKVWPFLLLWPLTLIQILKPNEVNN
ncbi:MAG: DUF2029 domain-containing protein [Bdellovibrionales bacterium]|nr:DUF2029 domain-containing protein [Bdellovibrionales bacterium]